MRVWVSKSRSSNSAFTLIELMVVIASVSLLAGTASLAYGKYVKRSQTTETYAMLTKIAELQVAYWHENGAFVATGPTNIPPAGAAPVDVNFEADPSHNWRTLRFNTDAAVRYGYRCYENSGPTDWLCEAQGDLDNDGDLALFYVNIVVSASGDPVASKVYFFDELE